MTTQGDSTTARAKRRRKRVQTELSDIQTQVNTWPFLGRRWRTEGNNGLYVILHYKYKHNNTISQRLPSADCCSSLCMVYRSWSFGTRIAQEMALLTTHNEAQRHYPGSSRRGTSNLPPPGLKSCHMSPEAVISRPRARNSISPALDACGGEVPGSVCLLTAGFGIRDETLCVQLHVLRHAVRRPTSLLTEHIRKFKTKTRKGQFDTCEISSCWLKKKMSFRIFYVGWHVARSFQCVIVRSHACLRN